MDWRAGGDSYWEATSANHLLAEMCLQEVELVALQQKPSREAESCLPMCWVWPCISGNLQSQLEQMVPSPSLQFETQSASTASVETAWRHLFNCSRWWPALLHGWLRHTPERCQVLDCESACEHMEAAPPFPDDRLAKPPLVCGLQVEKNTRTYKLILAGQILTFGEEARITHVYDSSTQQWKSGGDLPHEVYGVQKQCVFWNRSFHYVDCCANQVRAYDELDGMWRNVLPTIPSFVCSPTLVESNGDVLLVGAIGKFPKLEILELDSSRREWRKVDAVPVEAAVEAFLHKIVPGPRHASLLCVGQGGLIYVSNAGLNLTVLFDFLRRSWSFLPSRPASKVCILDVKAVFTFIPTFTTSVWAGANCKPAEQQVFEGLLRD